MTFVFFGRLSQGAVDLVVAIGPTEEVKRLGPIVRAQGCAFAALPARERIVYGGPAASIAATSTQLVRLGPPMCGVCVRAMWKVELTSFGIDE